MLGPGRRAAPSSRQGGGAGRDVGKDTAYAVGIDSDGNICILEMKNCTVDATIIPQVLQYAFWVESNPDSIKSLWLECDNRPDDIVITWGGVQVSILIVAPSILRSTLDLVVKINYRAAAGAD